MFIVVFIVITEFWRGIDGYGICLGRTCGLFGLYYRILNSKENVKVVVFSDIWF